VLAGRVDFVFGNINVVLPHVRSGALKALAIASDKRYALLPSTPTFSEVRMPEMEMSVWSGLFLPSGTPRAIAVALNDAVKVVARSNVLQPVYESAGATLEFDNSPEDFARVLQADTKKWVPVVKAMGVQVQ
jgi:tripartite-type tricarboxylate transporter receptor subunit TctC